MASIPMDQSGQRRNGGRNADRPPVSAHPAFPAIVALWFAALLGLGSLILPVQLIESVLTATGISALIPSAAPPLGFTARAAIALAATVAGALLGLYAARKVAGAATQPAVSVRETHSVHDYDDFDDFADEDTEADLPLLREEPVTLGRRRPLALAEEERPSDFLNVVPLPGGPVAEEEGYDDDALELGHEYTPVVEDSAIDEQPPEPAPAVTEAEQGEPKPPVLLSKTRSTAKVVEPLPFSPPSLARFGGYTSQPEPAFAAEEPEPEAHAAELLAAEAPEPEPVPETDVDISRHEQAFAPAAQPAPSSADGEVTGLVQLVQKLGQTLEKHREWAAQRAVVAATPSPGERAAPVVAVAEAVPAIAEFAEEFEPAPADDAAEAMAAWFGKSPAAAAEPAVADEVAIPSSPQAYAPFAGMGRLAVVDEAVDEEDEDDEIEQLAASFRLPVNSPASAPAPMRDASYSSLAAANPFRRTEEEFVRIEEPEVDTELTRPAVIFPSEEARRPQASAPAANTRPFDRPFDAPGTVPALAPAAAPAPVAQLHPEASFAAPASRPASNDDSERALREALMNLQRMGK